MTQHMTLHSTPWFQDAHECGLATIICCYQELAELYCEQLQGAGLHTTIDLIGLRP